MSCSTWGSSWSTTIRKRVGDVRTDSYSLRVRLTISPHAGSSHSQLKWSVLSGWVAVTDLVLIRSLASRTSVWCLAARSCQSVTGVAVERCRTRGIDPEDGVDSREPEDLEHARMVGDDRHGLAGVLEPLVDSHQDADAGRVHEATLAEVDDQRCRAVVEHTVHGGSELGAGEVVDLPGDRNDVPRIGKPLGSRLELGQRSVLSRRVGRGWDSPVSGGV